MLRTRIQRDYIRVQANTIATLSSEVTVKHHPECGYLDDNESKYVGNPLEQRKCRVQTLGKFHCSVT